METIELEYPVEVGGEKYEELKMRRPKVKDALFVNKSEGDEAEGECQLFANLCGVPKDVMQELDMADYSKVQKAWTSFLA